LSLRRILRISLRKLDALQNVKIMTNFKTVGVGMGRITAVITLCIVAAVCLSREVHGGPTQPPAAVPAPEASQELLQGQNSSLHEISPLILDIEFKKGAPFIEVFVEGQGPINCYDVREYEVRKDTSTTQIVPRLRRSKPEQLCVPVTASFRDKVADLDPSLNASYSVEVLGFQGWHKRHLNPKDYE
jgi:hypothetical protein